MVSLMSLWIPILVSAVLVFVASALSHSVLQFHRRDYGRLPGEAEVMELLRRLAVPPGDYLFPLAESPKAMKEPGFQEKWKRGPVGLLTALPNGGHPMGRTFALWFLYCVAVGVFAAYITGRAFAAGAGGRDLFLLAGVAAFGGHALAYWPFSIWNGRSWGATLRSTVDALVYGLATGAAFAWLWPR
jgi:hypothetical protein